MSYWIGKDGWRVALIRKPDVEAIAKLTNMPVGSGKQLDAAVAELVELAGQKTKSRGGSKSKEPSYMTEDELAGVSDG